MKYLANADKAKYIDSLSTDKYFIPSIVLMERAAYETAKVIMNDDETKSLKNVLVIAGNGNNGGDAIAAGRIIHENGFNVNIFLTGAVDSMTEQTKLQYNIAKASGVNVIGDRDTDTERYDNIFSGYDIIIDGIFGVGLSRDVTGKYYDIIEAVNKLNSIIYSIDMPSGINASTGQVMKTAVRAVHTVTYGLLKTGLALYCGREYAGKVSVVDIGFPHGAVRDADIREFFFEQTDMDRLPARKSLSNKGTYGKVLVVAGGREMGGAAFMSAKAAYRSGCGLVKVLTCSKNVPAISCMLPEAIVAGLEWDDYDSVCETVCREVSWADAVVIGPGLGTDKMACNIVKTVLQSGTCSIVADADAINIIADRSNKEIRGLYSDNLERIVITPHLKEMSRLSADEISKMRDDMSDYVTNYCARNKGVILALKDACTVVGDGNAVYFNMSGNDAMATGGSGDILTGVIASFMAQGLDRYDAACMGVYVHGLAGDDACVRLNRYSVMAGDIIESLSNVLKIE